MLEDCRDIACSRVGRDIVKFTRKADPNAGRLFVNGMMLGARILDGDAAGKVLELGA